MDKAETGKIVYLLISSYPNSYTKLSDLQTALMLELWGETFQDVDYKTVQNALKCCILMKNNFPPTIAEVNQLVCALLEDGELINKLTRAELNNLSLSTHQNRFLRLRILSAEEKTEEQKLLEKKEQEEYDMLPF